MIVSGNTIDSITKYQTDSCSDRQTSGFICTTCDILSTCIKIGQTWQTISLEVCDAAKGLYCNQKLGSCSNSTGPCNPIGQPGNFVCTSPGVFPDPYDCQLYHMCYTNGLNLVAINVNCGRNAAFNPTTGDCSLTTNASICSEPMFNCDIVGRMQAWPGNNNIFYVCHAKMQNNDRILFPELHRCSSNEVFSNGECLSKVFSLGLTTIAVPPVNNFICPSFGLYAAEDCRYYHYCNGFIGSQLIKCSDGSYFDKTSSACVRGIC